MWLPGTLCYAFCSLREAGNILRMSSSASIASVPRVPLAQLPTPLLRLERLSRDAGAHIWIKRDDLTGLELSGNKVRKLEFIVADALEQGCDTLVTEGTPQSNHCRATAMVCAKLGLKCVLLIRPEPGGPATGNFWLDSLVGAEIRSFARPRFDEHRAELVDQTLRELRASGRKPRWIPMGASEPLGCLGYVECARELTRQLSEFKIEDCELVVAVSSAGTYAGLVLGAQLYKLPARIHGILVSDSLDFQRAEIEALCAGTAERFKLAKPAAPFHLWDAFIGPGYAKFYPQVHEAIRKLACSEGIVLDPVYTAKAFHGMLALLRQGMLDEQKPVVFLHTGGVFSTFAWTSEIMTAPSEA